MLKILFICLLLVLASSLTHAEIYKCKDASGIVSFTNDPSLVPTGCKPEILKDFPPPVTTQDSQAPEDKRPFEKSEEAAASPQADKTNGESLKTKANKMVDEFTTARAKLYPNAQRTEKFNAIKKLTDIRLQKKQLITEVEQSGLSQLDKEEIISSLSAITEEEE